MKGIMPHVTHYGRRTQKKNPKNNTPPPNLQSHDERPHSVEKCLSSAMKERVQWTWSDATQCRLLSPSGAIRKNSGKLSKMQVTKSISITHFPITFLSGSLACTFAGQSVKKQGCFIEPHHAAYPKGEFIKVVLYKFSLRKWQNIRLC